MKRGFDVAAAIAILLLSSPILLVAALLIAWRMGRPIVFRQLRPGRDERIFELLKLRTMSDARDAQGELFPPDQRLTSLGRVLRRASVDELPQLFNVLRGEMSLVGPRPLLVDYLPRYSERQKMRHMVLPGITGLAQVSGRNAISWARRLELDAWYVENWSLRLDLRILALTALRVVRRDGVEPPDAAYMPIFTGNDPHPPEDAP